MYDKVTFAVARFYIDCVWGSKSKEISKNYAASVCLNPNQTDLEIMNELYEGAEINSQYDYGIYVSGYAKENFKPRDTRIEIAK